MGLFGTTSKKAPVTEPKERRNMITVKKHDEEIADLKKAHSYELQKAKQDNELKILELKQLHDLELKEKSFEIKHFKDEELQKMKVEKDEALKEQAVLKNENKMLHEIVDLNADIIDIKDLVKKLIEKLPTVNLQSLTMQQLGSGGK